MLIACGTQRLLKEVSMKKRSFFLLCLFTTAGTLLSACGPKISQEQYINAMTGLGCKGLMESSPEAFAVYQTIGVTQEEISEFRQKAGKEKVLQAATKIAENVAGCFNVNLKP